MIWLMEWHLPVPVEQIIFLFQHFSLHVFQIEEESWGKGLGTKGRRIPGMGRK